MIFMILLTLWNFEQKKPKTSLALTRELVRMGRIKGSVSQVCFCQQPFWQFMAIKVLCLILNLHFLHFCAILMNLWIFLHFQQIFVYNQLFVYIFISKEIIMQIVINLEDFGRIWKNYNNNCCNVPNHLWEQISL